MAHGRYAAARSWHPTSIGTRCLAPTHAHQDGARRHLPERQRPLRPDETVRPRLGMPMRRNDVTSMEQYFSFFAEKQ
jgi:hypothetical protein